MPAPLSRRTFDRGILTAAVALPTDPMFVNADSVLSLPRGYHLVWHDDFSHDGRPDPRNWNYEHGFVRNRELQWYQPQNAFCRDGRLILEARRPLRK